MFPRWPLWLLYYISWCHHLKKRYSTIWPHVPHKITTKSVEQLWRRSQKSFPHDDRQGSPIGRCDVIILSFLDLPNDETNLQTIPARSQPYYKSFLPSTTRIWKTLPDDTKNSPSVESFKHKLNNNITKPPRNYFSGSRLGQIYHPRIQLNCSLRYHLFQQNIIDTPVCECSEIENTSHFFLHCNLYVQLRHELLNRISTYFFDLILYVHSTIFQLCGTGLPGLNQY